MDPFSYKHSAHKTSEGRVPSPHSYALSGKIMLSAIIILFSVVLFILFLHFYVRWHVLRRATRRAARRLRFAVENHSPSASKAIDPAVLNSLPVLLFSAVPGETDECECAVCLTEFEDGEKIRNLPPCGHCFHVDCIDMWFASHSNCPLCRAAVEALDLNSGAEGGEVGSTSSGSGEGEFAVEGLGGEGERVGIGRALKWPINRIVLLRRFFGLSGAVLDLEEGGGRGAAPPPPAM